MTYRQKKEVYETHVQKAQSKLLHLQYLMLKHSKGKQTPWLKLLGEALDDFYKLDAKEPKR